MSLRPAPALMPQGTLLSFAESLADAARPIAMTHFRTRLDVESKADDSPVTIADRAIEARLRAMIEQRHPSHGIFGEETGATPGDGSLWVIDPIDGTKSFVTGLPLFGTLLAHLQHGVPVLGVVDIPVLGERWTAEAEGPALLNGVPVRVSDCRALASARFMTTSPEGFHGKDEAAYRRLSEAVGLRRFGGDCYAYALLASGHCDLIAECGLQPYDYLALVPVIEGAGGVVTDWNGAPLGLDSDGRVLAAATPELHDAAMALLRG
ncbi:histidinol-phosphatase, inositol monophosphatase family [Aureimonas altamirensis DSM 21988]|uniref:Histidinol-phosphatase n=1 Tax=Aureimonas altamirensis DSM 21988 TaxID=1121026 RepID=A0ABY1IN78_9HYPH|nr:histidinol-phosphatase [Aureimonas altamirensis]SHJ54941.1 histidinol-phosphatase, inositol monophosphatase family [Aureimonas altamirensis DSM 21988]